MAEYRAAQQTTSLSDPQNIVTSRLNQLNDAATRARTIRAQKESLLRQIEALGAGAADSIPAISANTYIQSIKARLADLQRQRALLTERYGDKHPEMVSLTASIQDVTQQLTAETAKAVDTIRHEYESAVLEERTLARALSDQQSVATDLDRRGVAYTMLERQAASNRQLYETLLQREKELQVLANSRGNNVRIVERATDAGGGGDARRHAQPDARPAGGAVRRLRPGVRARLPRRHHQDRRRPDPQARAALPGPGAGAPAPRAITRCCRRAARASSASPSGRCAPR